MNNFANIDENRIATPKQFYGVACHFARIHAQSPSEQFGLTKVFNAVLNKVFSESDLKMTHGDVQKYFELETVPTEFLKLVKKPKASKKQKASKKSQTVAEAIENIDSKKASKAKPKPKAPAMNSVAKKMDNRITALETKVSEVDSKLDAILEILQK